MVVLGDYILHKESIKDAINGYLHVQVKHGKPYIFKKSQVFIWEVVV